MGVQRARERLTMWKDQEHLRPRDRSWSACSMWRRTRQFDMAKDLGLRGGYSLNRETKDIHTNKSWNLLEKKDHVQLITL